MTTSLRLNTSLKCLKLDIFGRTFFGGALQIDLEFFQEELAVALESNSSLEQLHVRIPFMTDDEIVPFVAKMAARSRLKRLSLVSDNDGPNTPDHFAALYETFAKNYYLEDVEIPVNRNDEGIKSHGDLSFECSGSPLPH